MSSVFSSCQYVHFIGQVIVSELGLECYDSSWREARRDPLALTLETPISIGLQHPTTSHHSSSSLPAANSNNNNNANKIDADQSDSEFSISSITDFAPVFSNNAPSDDEIELEHNTSTSSFSSNKKYGKNLTREEKKHLLSTMDEIFGEKAPKSLTMDLIEHIVTKLVEQYPSFKRFDEKALISKIRRQYYNNYKTA